MTKKFTFLLSFIFSTIALFGQTDSCYFDLELYSSKGDGWAGANVIVSGASNGMTNYTMTLGAFSRFRFYVKNNASVQLNYKRGTEDQKVSYQLKNKDGIILYKSTVFPDTGIVFNQRLRCSDCQAVTTVFPINIKAVTARIGWEPVAGANRYLIYMAKKGFNPDTVKSVLSTTDTFALVGGLMEHNYYEWYISTICSNGDTSYRNGPFEFRTLWKNDVGIVGIVTPENACNLGGAESVTVLIKNFGGSPQAPIPFKYSVNNTNVSISMPEDGVFTNVLGKDSVSKIEFETKFNFSIAGEYVVKAWTALSNDSQTANDTFTKIVTSIPTINLLPYQTSFDSWTGGWLVSPKSSNATWQFGKPNNPYISNAQSLNNCYSAWMDDTQNEYSYLVSPCLDFSSVNIDPKISFALNRHLNKGELWLESSTNDTLWTKIGTLNSGLNWYNDTTQVWKGSNGKWEIVENTLTGLSKQANAKVRFVLKSNSNEGGVAIDNIRVYTTLSKDLAGASVSTNLNGECSLKNDSIRLAITNLGNITENNFTVSYKLSNGATVTETPTGLSIPPKETKIYTFKVSPNFFNPGTVTLKAWVTLSGDGARLNDTASFVFSNGGLNMPLAQTFESGYPAEWQPSTFFKVNKGKVKNSKVLSADLTGIFNKAILTTPLYGKVEYGDTLRFEWALIESGLPNLLAAKLTAKDTFKVQIARNCDSTNFVTVFQVDSSNYIPSTQMRIGRIPLGNYIGDYIRIRIVATRGGSNPFFAEVDNINTARCKGFKLNEVIVPTTGGQNNGRITLTPEGGQEPYSYQWSNGGNIFKISSLAPGSYYVTITDLFGCSTQAGFDILMGTSVTEPSALLENILVAPNPTNGITRLQVSFKEQVNHLQLQLLAPTGKLLWQESHYKVTENQSEIDLSSFPTGLYFIRVVADGQQWVQKVVRLQ